MTPPPDESLVRSEQRHLRRWALIRDLAVFQLKIALDGLKDIVLVPLSLVAGIVGLFTKRADPRAPLRKVMRFGKRYEEWIDLYEDLERSPRPTDARLNGYLSRLERALAQQSRAGGLTAKARSAIENALDVLAGDANAGASERAGRDGSPDRDGSSDRTG